MIATIFSIVLRVLSSDLVLYLSIFSFCICCLGFVRRLLVLDFNFDSKMF